MMIQRYKYILRVFAISITVLAAGCSTMFVNERAVSLEDVVFLTRHGLSSEVITKHIANTESRFDLTTEDLVTLKDAGVENEVIAFMLDRNGPQPPFASEYGRPAIPGTMLYTTPMYYESRGFVPLYETYSETYETTQPQFNQPAFRQNGLIGRFDSYSPDAFYGTDFSSRFGQWGTVDEAETEADDETDADE